jgi:hypothetical protein
VGTPRRAGLAVSVHADRGGWVVRWRDGRRQRSRRFASEAEAIAFDEGAGSLRGRGAPNGVGPRLAWEPRARHAEHPRHLSGAKQIAQRRARVVLFDPIAHTVRLTIAATA